MSLIFNTLSRFLMTFLLRGKCLLISWQQSPFAVILELKKIKSVTVSIVPSSICHEVMGSSFFECWVLSQFFHSPLSLSSRHFSSSSLSAIRVVSSGYLRLLFLLASLIPVLDSSSPAFHMMYSVYKLNKQGDNIQPWHTPFPTLNQSIVPCSILTVAFCPANRFLRRHVSWSRTPISYRTWGWVIICWGWGCPVGCWTTLMASYQLHACYLSCDNQKCLYMPNISCPILKPLFEL